MSNPIEIDTALAVALGRLAGRWGQAEFAVEMIYVALSEMPHRKAIISFSFHKGPGTQADIIRHLADETDWITDAERELIKGAVGEFSSKSALRNHWIHYPLAMTAMRRKLPYTRLRELEKAKSCISRSILTLPKSKNSLARYQSL